MKTFIDNYVALIEGDDAKAQAEKASKQAKSALNSHLTSYEGDKLDLEDNVETAKTALENARVNHGRPITDRNSYITRLVDAKNQLTHAEDELKAHNETMAFLKEELDSFGTE